VAVAQRAGRRVDVHSCSCYRGSGVRGGRGGDLRRAEL
jgi:hypothetical protein